MKLTDMVHSEEIHSSPCQVPSVHNSLEDFPILLVLYWIGVHKQDTTNNVIGYPAGHID
jgi:hypothetical protein